MKAEYQRYLGLELSGTRSDRSALCVVEYYPKSKRLVLREVLIKLQSAQSDNPDQTLIDNIQVWVDHGFSGLGVSTPLSLPPAFLDPSGNTRTDKLEIRWMELQSKKNRKADRAHLPYLQRACEVALRNQTPPLEIPDAFGSNLAPLTARAHHLKRNFPSPLFETHSKSAARRIGRSLGIATKTLDQVPDLENGLLAREQFLDVFSRKVPQFFAYDHDLETLIQNLSAFWSLQAALSVFLVAKEQIQKAPRGFPPGVPWIYVPNSQIGWKDLF
jgi:hypothetical protein